MDSLVTVIVLLIASVVGTWLKKRAQREEESGMTGQQPDLPPPANRPGQPPTSPQRPRPRPVRWEEELRRLLEGEVPGLPPSLPRPILAEVPESPRPVPVVPPPPLVATTSASDPMSSLPVPEFTEVADRDLAPMRESSQAYQRASQTDEVAAGRIQNATPESAVPSSLIARQRASHEAAEVIALFKNARTARQAIIASIILRPPKALEE